MFPTLFSIGGFPISSFGVFLAVGFAYGIFLIWRLARAWEINEEKVLDLIILTFLGGLLGARLYFVVEHLDFFSQNLINIFLVLKYPGFSFWGAFLGGWLSLFIFSKRLKLDFLSLADIAAVGFLAGLIWAEIGCFLGGCNVGIPSKLFFAVPMLGLVGKRFPVQILESLLLLFALLKVWKRATHFHQRGSIVSFSLILIGIIKLLTEPLRQTQPTSYIFSAVLLLLGIIIFYRIQHGRRTLLKDLRLLLVLLTSLRSYTSAISRLRKSWYNQRIAFSWKIKSLGKILRRLRVKSSPKNTTFN